MASGFVSDDTRASVQGPELTTLGTVGPSIFMAPMALDAVCMEERRNQGHSVMAGCEGAGGCSALPRFATPADDSCLDWYATRK
jgi:hypothetical protein